MAFRVTSASLATSISMWLVFSVAGQEHLGGEAASIMEKLRSIAETEGTEEALERSEKLIGDLFMVDRMLVWKHERQRGDWVCGAWPGAGTVYLTSRSGDKVQLLDSATGREKATVALPSRTAWRSAWMKRIEHSGKMLLTVPGQILTLDPESGKITETLQYKHDWRIAPTVFEGDYVVVNGYRGTSLLRLNKEGEVLWDRHLPGYIMVHPALYDHIAIVQTRQSDYGGQSTFGVDLRTGKLLWSDTVDAYGCGAAFVDDGLFVVEACLLLSPGDTFGWIICRNPETGERLWEYRRPGSIFHQPLAEGTSNRILALFGTGVIVCMEGHEGSIIWETHLPAIAPRWSGSSFEPYSPVMRLHNDKLMVLDVRDILHLLDVKTGKVLRSFPTVSRFSPDGRRSSKDSLVTMPWVDRGVLIVPSKRGTSAYPAPQVLGEDEPLELQMRALRVQWLLRQGEVEKAAKEVALMEESRPEEPLTLESSAEVYRAKKDSEGEVIARLRLMRNTGAESDARLLELTGLLKRISCGYGCGPPLLVGERLYVGSADGRLRTFDAKTASLVSELDVMAAITGSLAYHDGVIAFPTENRHVRGVSPDLRQLFDWSAPGEHSLYIPVDNKLVRSSPYIGFAHVAVLDLEKQGFGPEARVDCSANRPVVYKERLYYPQKGGGSASYDGQGVMLHAPKVAVDEYRVSNSGEYPIAYGSGGVCKVDEDMRPVEHLIAMPGKTFAATVNEGIILTLSMRNDGSDWMLEAWRETGEKLSLNYTTPAYYHTTMDPLPTLLPFGDGFLLVGREIAYVSPYEEKPIWRFWPGGLADSDAPSFKGPVIDGDSVMFTRGVGDLYVFDKNRITGPLQKKLTQQPGSPR